MNNLTLGCIGAGNMGGAILKGLIPQPSLRLLAHDRTRAKVEALGGPHGTGAVEWMASPQELAAAAHIILLAVKPAQIEDMVRSIRPQLTSSKILISVAAAISMGKIKGAADDVCPVARLMPNLPVLAGKGVFALCLDDPTLKPEDGLLLTQLFEALGMVTVLPEDKFAAFSSVAGCGPAYVCVLMEAMQNAAVSMGLPAALAREMAAATVEGSATLALQTGESFADLRAKVCSPGGTTIQAVNHLERTAVRGHITDAILKAWERDQAMSGK